MNAATETNLDANSAEEKCRWHVSTGDRLTVLQGDWVAEQSGRNVILCDRNPEYIQIIKQSCNVTPGMAF